MWGWISAAVALYVVARSRPSPASVAVAAANDDASRAVAAALTQETDPNVLLDFAAKLRAAGRDSDANALGARAVALHPLAAREAARRPAAALMLARGMAGAK